MSSPAPETPAKTTRKSAVKTVEVLVEKEVKVYEPVAKQVAKTFLFAAVGSLTPLALSVVHGGTHPSKDVFVAALSGAAAAGLHAAKETFQAWRRRKAA